MSVIPDCSSGGIWLEIWGQIRGQAFIFEFAAGSRNARLDRRSAYKVYPFAYGLYSTAMDVIEFVTRNDQTVQHRELGGGAQRQNVPDSDTKWNVSGWEAQVAE